MPRVIGGPNQQIRVQRGTLGVSDVANAHLRAAAENVPHPVDRGQTATVPPAPPNITTVQQTRPLDTGVEGATPDDTRDQGSAGGEGRGNREPRGRPI